MRGDFVARVERVLLAVHIHVGCGIEVTNGDRRGERLFPDDFSCGRIQNNVMPLDPPCGVPGIPLMRVLRTRVDFVSPQRPAFVAWSKAGQREPLRFFDRMMPAASAVQ